MVEATVVVTEAAIGDKDRCSRSYLIKASIAMQPMTAK
jgi:hypothetical protein